MGFVRIKKIKGKEYAYLVENKWTINGCRQSVKGYLGKLFRFDKGSNDFIEFIGGELDTYIKDNSYLQVIKDVIGFELVKHGFKEKDFILVNGECNVDLRNKRVFNSRNSNVVIAMNEGYLHSDSLKELIRFDINGDVMEEGRRFAKLLVESGLDVPRELFVAMIEKISK